MTTMNKNEIEQLINANLHLKKYLESISQKVGEPVFYAKVPREVKNEQYPNLIYPTKGTVFVHIYKTPDMDEPEYHTIEPLMDDTSKEKRNRLLKKIVEKVPQKKDVLTDEDLNDVLKDLIDDLTVIDERASDVEPEKKHTSGTFGKKEKIRMTSFQKEVIQYDIIKTLVGNGPLECFMRDPYLEDIHFVGGEKIHLIHKVFGMIKTNVIVSNKDAPAYARTVSEKMGSPVSEGRPIVDGVLPDGSRGNIIYSSAISIKGPSMTIRRFTETPISVTQLIKWGTLSSSIGAYLWLCLQYGRSFFLCGGTACGKTTTMNAIIPFIPAEKKIYTAEGTPELQVPHTVWQRLLTKTTGPKEGQVDLFDLLRAALRSRPDYIIPGEVRGAEGSIVFQAMQTGHPCMTTFHAGSVKQVIQRFTGDPINVPKTFMDNLDFVLIQLAVERGGKTIRRCTSMEEIEGYNREVDGIMSRISFEWKPDEDVHVFKAYKNSFTLEEKIAKNAGYSDPMMIYEEFDRRKHVLDRMVEADIMDYYEVVQCIWGFYKSGEKGLPITV